MRKLLLLVAFLFYAQPAAACGTDVLVFDAYWCGHCKNTKSFLSMNNIRYRTIEITQNQHHWNNVLSTNFGVAGVPVVVIDGRWNGMYLVSSHRIIRGHSESALREALCF